MRLQKLLASTGIASRRKIEEWIAQGRIKVNAEIASIGQKVTADDKIFVDGVLIPKHKLTIQKPRRVIIYNKPEGVVCTKKDEQNRKTIFDLLPKFKNDKIISIGRLDINTTGLLLLTNDGELANRLMHPSSQIDREYAVRIRGHVSDEIIENLLNGVTLSDGFAKFTDIKRAPRGEGYNHWFHCTLMEGRNREVRRLWESQGLQVSRLKRVRFGPVFLESALKAGKFRDMTEKEISILASEVGLK